jgi:quercetin dioxygenase-like cupin family protein
MPFIDLKDLPIKAPRPGWAGRFFHSEQMTFGFYEMSAGATIHAHAHENEEVWHVIEGELEITLAGHTQVAGAGSVAVVPANTMHAVRVLTAGRAMVVDHPRRGAIGDIET